MFAGCAIGPLSRPLTKETCVDGEWQEVGLRDGRNGTPESRDYQRFVKECAQFSSDLSGEKAAYRRGLEEGFVVYCHVKNAERIGEAGQRFHEMNCPAGERQALMQAYRRGQIRGDERGKSAAFK